MKINLVTYSEHEGTPALLLRVHTFYLLQVTMKTAFNMPQAKSFNSASCQSALDIQVYSGTGSFMA